MTHRKPFVGGNWKMNTNLASASRLAEEVSRSCSDFAQSCDVAVFPPFPYLLPASRVLNEAVHLGAQNVWHEPDGAFTGEVSIHMLSDLDVRYVLAGHSERRHVLGENDELVNRKVRAVLKAGLSVVLCVGELLDQREAGQTATVVLGQLNAGLAGVSSDELQRVVIAYEPVWAIGTGRTALPEDAQEVHQAIRKAAASGYDGRAAEALRIVYGGSVKGANASGLFAQPDIDGGLIGGASLDSGEFQAIVQAAVTA